MILKELLKTRRLLKIRLPGRTDLLLEFKLAYLWAGAFWNTEYMGKLTTWNLWICLIPCFPMHFRHWYESKEHFYYQ